MADDEAKLAGAEEKDAKAKVIFVIVAILALAIVIGSHSDHRSTPAVASSGRTSTAAARSNPTVPSAPGIGQVAKDGDFAFVVKSVSCGAQAAAAVNAGGIGERVPTGAQECIVSMSVTNDKTQAQTFFDSNQYGYDAKGRQFSADSNGSIFLAGDQDMDQINPGITVTARVPFQIPAGDTMVKIVLHDSAYSGGVTVRL
ncbi:MAG: DUF4352 domain-containing protein [Acidimicrobiales bacterium]